MEDAGYFEIVFCFPYFAELLNSYIWTLPKRPPNFLDLDKDNEHHLKFILYTASLYAKVYKVPFDPQYWNLERVANVSIGLDVPQFKAKNKNYVTDESVSKDEAPKESSLNEDDFQVLCNELERLSGEVNDIDLFVEDFEKDDDTNYHVAFIHSCSSLRAFNYSIKPVDFMETKRISGKIIPAIATTTATVSGLVTLELIKVIAGNLSIESLRNTFLNLAIPVFGSSEPGLPQRIHITGDAYYTVWEKWEVKGTPDVTIQQFCKIWETKYNLKVTGIFHDVAMIYLNVLPNHKPRLNKKLKDFIKDVTDPYVDLIVTFADQTGKDVSGPTIRFYLK